MRNKQISQSLCINSFYNGKYKQYNTQLKTIFSYLHENIATASMVANATGIPQKCITRYKRDLEKRNLIFELEKKTCKHTGFKAWYLTTNKEVYLKFIGKEVKDE